MFWTRKFFCFEILRIKLLILSLMNEYYFISIQIKASGRSSQIGQKFVINFSRTQIVITKSLLVTSHVNLHQICYSCSDLLFCLNLILNFQHFIVKVCGGNAKYVDKFRMNIRSLIYFKFIEENE
jgi:hypothetical protein